jgi:co-chaperonin GroES (HSP10)
MIELLQDYFIVSIERKYEDTKTKSGIILLNAAYVDDGDMDRYQSKRLYGDVVEAPVSFSDTPYQAVYDGMPSYRKFIGHDNIVDKINRGYRNHAEKSYYPSTFDNYDVVTMADIAKNVHVQKGDRIYFLPQCTEPENFIQNDGDKMLYKICVTDIMCAVRPGIKDTDDGLLLCDRIWMQGEWVLVKPNMETWEEITTKSGIIMKPHPTAKVLEGTVAFHTKHPWVNEGDRIVYLPNADCEVTVEGEKYWVMPVSDIIGKLK